MIKLLTTLLFTVLLTSPAMAEKPEWAGKGKPTAEQKEAHKAAMNAKEGLDKDVDVDVKHEKDERDEKSEKKPKDIKGLEKQQAKKADQVQKELDQGSEKGIESRENRKKWWKFW